MTVTVVAALPKNARKLYRILAEITATGRVCCPCVKELAVWLTVTPRTVINNLNRLEDYELIIRRRRYVDGRRVSNQYIVRDGPHAEVMTGEGVAGVVRSRVPKGVRLPAPRVDEPVSLAYSQEHGIEVVSTGDVSCVVDAATKMGVARYRVCAGESVDELRRALYVPEDYSWPAEAVQVVAGLSGYTPVAGAGGGSQAAVDARLRLIHPGLSVAAIQKHCSLLRVDLIDVVAAVRTIKARSKEWVRVKNMPAYVATALQATPHEWSSVQDDSRPRTRWGVDSLQGVYA